MSKDTIKKNKAKCNQCQDILESVDEHTPITCTCSNLIISGGTVAITRQHRFGTTFTELSEYE